MGLLYSTDLSIWPVILELCDKNAICDDMKALTLREARRNWEREFIVAALRRNDMNVTAAARELDFVREPLCRKLKDFGDRDRQREAAPPAKHHSCSAVTPETSPRLRIMKNPFRKSLDALASVAPKLTAARAALAAAEGELRDRSLDAALSPLTRMTSSPLLKPRGCWSTTYLL